MFFYVREVITVELLWLNGYRLLILTVISETHYLFFYYHWFYYASLNCIMFRKPSGVGGLRILSTGWRT